jgi:Ca2+-binding EF-hand superfamily protein
LIQAVDVFFQRKGWGAKLIGFREVILATENIYSLREPADILQWIFRIYDSEAAGELPVRKLTDIIKRIIV